MKTADNVEIWNVTKFQHDICAAHISPLNWNSNLKLPSIPEVELPIISITKKQKTFICEVSRDAPL
jgi:hypothetical protein